MKILANKKAVELTMSTIIIAVLVILVLIILVLIFGKSIQNFFSGTSGCANQGGQCQSPNDGKCEDGYSNYFAGNPECDGKVKGNICCKKESDILGIGTS